MRLRPSRCVVSYGRHREKQVGLRDFAHHRCMHFFRRLHPDDGHARRLGKRSGAAYQRDFRAGITECYGDRIAHFPRA